MQSLTIFLALNQYSLETSADDAVPLMVGIAAGDTDEDAAEAWIRGRIVRLPKEVGAWPARSALVGVEPLVRRGRVLLAHAMTGTIGRVGHHILEQAESHPELTDLVAGPGSAARPDRPGR